MPKDKEKPSKQGCLNWDPDEIPGDTTYLYKQNRFREPWEFRGASKPVAREEHDELIEAFSALKEQFDELGNQYDAMSVEVSHIAGDRDRLSKELKKNTQAFRKAEKELRIWKTTQNAEQERLRELANEATAAAKVYQEAGQVAIKLLLEYGDHLPDCNLIDLRCSGRLVDMTDLETCTCEWSKTLKWLKEAKAKGESGQLTDEEIKSILQR